MSQTTIYQRFRRSEPIAALVSHLARTKSTRRHSSRHTPCLTLIALIALLQAGCATTIDPVIDSADRAAFTVTERNTKPFSPTVASSRDESERRQVGSSRGDTTDDVELCRIPAANTLNSVVQIYAKSGDFSSGVVIDQNLVLSVAHGVLHQPEIVIKIGDTFKRADVIAVNPSDDLALLHVDTESIPSLALSLDLMKKNESVWAVGFPLGMGQRTSLGLLQTTDANNLYTSAHVNRGSSGGALVRCHPQTGFELAGIVKGYLAHDTGTQMINVGDSIAVGSATIERFIASSLTERMQLTRLKAINASHHSSVFDHKQLTNEPDQINTDAYYVQNARQ